MPAAPRSASPSKRGRARSATPKGRAASATPTPKKRTGKSPGRKPNARPSDAAASPARPHSQHQTGNTVEHFSDVVSYGTKRRDTPREAATRLAAVVSLLTLAPIFVITLVWAIERSKGSALDMLTWAAVEGIQKYVDADVLLRCLRCVGVFAFAQMLLMVLVPGTAFDGPVTPAGVAPKYRDNGFRCFVITHLILWFSGSAVLEKELVDLPKHHGSLLVVLNVSALLFCLVLYFKGIHWPTFPPPDSGRTGYGALFDYYWGTELHPRIFAESTFDLKQWVNCRLGMMGWSVLLVAFLRAHMELHGGVPSWGFLASFVLQQTYIAKFFYWENGYIASIDVMHDRLGFYICWGCLVWLPSLYTSGAYFLYQHSAPGTASDMPKWAAIVTIALGAVCVVITYLADEQRQHVRRKGGKANVWGREARVIHAEYTSSDFKTHKSILLTSGWWSISRHFHYVTEWAGAFLWTLPTVFVPGAGLLAWTYPIFLFILLWHRAARDEERCKRKYGKYWEEYSLLVPSRVIPGIW